MKILSSLSRTPRVLAHLARIEGAEQHLIIPQFHIDGNDDGNLDRNKKRTDRLKQTWSEYLAFSGQIQLDWEGRVSRALANPAHDPLFEHIVRELGAALRYFGDIFPNATFDFYNVGPIRKWWQTTDDWFGKQRYVIEELIKLQRADGTRLLGALCVVCYADDQVPPAKEYVGIVEKAIEFGGDYDLLVHCMIWDRYQDHTRGVGFRRMPDAIYTDHAKMLADIEWNGTHIDGFMAWSGLAYYLRTLNETDADGEFKKLGSSAMRQRNALWYDDTVHASAQGLTTAEWVDEVHIHTLDMLADALGITVNPPGAEPPPTDFEATVLSLAVQAKLDDVRESQHAMGVAVKTLHEHLTGGE